MGERGNHRACRWPSRTELGPVTRLESFAREPGSHGVAEQGEDTICSESTTHPRSGGHHELLHVVDERITAESMYRMTAVALKEKQFDRIARVEVPGFIRGQSVHHGERFSEHCSEHYRPQHLVAFGLFPNLAEQDGFDGKTHELESGDDRFCLFSCELHSVRSLPPSIAIWAPVVAAKAGLTNCTTVSATCAEVISIFRRLRVLYCSTVMP